ncbi:uncharacterized protein N7484_005221 [Penicillium longicatenatum]|uniref:uncharacterized protein n=1 Tax=Penicillium longicatenatum TaxID=1561947 RepID=UPI002547D39A|nr:uncharacterized protein N7484_005221 [Penicillium longicatenatum]KAJ5651498.1 hypothetical protein N7484_005221 [Penicillium longicatenatum]
MACFPMGNGGFPTRREIGTNRPRIGQLKRKLETLPATPILGREDRGDITHKVPGEVIWSTIHACAGSPSLEEARPQG